MSRESTSGRYIGNPLFEATAPISQALTSNSSVTCANQAANPGGPGNYYQHPAEASAR